MLRRRYLILLPLLLYLCGCAAVRTATDDGCRIVLEAGEGFQAEAYTAETAVGGEAVFVITENDGYTVTGSDYADCDLIRSRGGVTLVLHGVRYTQTVRLAVQRSDVTITYDPNGGEPAGRIELPVTASHARLNTAGAVFTREGYTLIGWNTEPDGSGEAVGLGSRVTPSEGLVLYAQWAPWTDEALFTFEDGAVTGCAADAPGGVTLVIPPMIGGEVVETVRAGAFAGCEAVTVVLPETLRTVEDGAFTGAGLETLYLFDSVESVSDRAFDGCDNLATLHINAVEPPVYSGTYYATFADKYDRLYGLAETQKLVLFSGSSARFGYDSAAIDAAFPAFGVVNMGVFAYTNALPQMELIRTLMRPGDVLLVSPELDAAKRQFCTTDSLDAPFFNMMEANYDMLAALDLRDYTNVFASLNEYLYTRRGMAASGYAVTPADFDEDGAPVSSPSYNAYGDYIVYRPNAADDAPLYGLPVPYTASYYLQSLYIDPFNRELARFTGQGVVVYMTYSPRNRLAVSADSTDEAIAALDAYFRRSIDAPIISDIFDSLVSGVYLYGTDNHLSTEGVAIRTAQIIDDLRAQMENDGLL